MINKVTIPEKCSIYNSPNALLYRKEMQRGLKARKSFLHEAEKEEMVQKKRE